MRSRWMAVMILLSSPIWANPQQVNPDVGAMLSEGKKPCDEDKKKAEAEAKKDEQALQNLLGDSADKKPAEPGQKSLGAVPTMGNCK